MKSYSTEREHLIAKITTVGRWLGVTLLLAISCYLLVLPLFRPRGDFLWGYYRLKDIYAGIPIGLVLLGALAVRASPSKNRRRLALRLLSVFVSVIITIIVVDVVYAFVVRGALRPDFWLDQADIPRTYNIADSELGFVRKPDVSWRGYTREANRIVDYRTDKNGFRNPSTEQQVADVVFIGDSFTEAVEVNEDDTFVRRVADATKLSVVNLGRGGFGHQQQLIVLQKYGLTYKPRFVIWQLFEGNDLMDADNFAGWKKPPGHSNSSLKERYFDNSFVARLLSKTRTPERSIRWFAIRSSDGTAARIPVHYFYQPAQPAEVPIGVAETNRTIAEIYHLCQSERIELLIIFVPVMARVMAPYVTPERKEDGSRLLARNASIHSKDFTGLMAERCAQIGCTFIDSFAALREQAATDNHKLYIPRDEHLDVRGHEVVAHLIVDWMRNTDTQSATKNE